MNARTKSMAAKTIVPKLCAAVALSALVLLGGLHRAEAGVDVWTPIGPYGGNISSLAIDTQPPATLYAAIGTGTAASRWVSSRAPMGAAAGLGMTRSPDGQRPSAVPARRPLNEAGEEGLRS